MATFFDDDIVDVQLDQKVDGKHEVRQYYWGDPCEIVAQGAKATRVKVRGADGDWTAGAVSPSATFRNGGILKLSMVDVQQGDGLILETPKGNVVFIDGGDNKLFARHAAARFPGTTAGKPLPVEAMIVTHGDADHFAGLSELIASETNSEPRKRVFVAPRRILHNGLVKAPSKTAAGKSTLDTELLGKTVENGGKLYCTELFENLLTVDDDRMNAPFRTWKATLKEWNKRTKAKTGKPIAFHRVDQTRTGVFDFLADDGISVEVLGPISEQVKSKPSLEFLRAPPKSANLELGTAPGKKGGYSASHTINGHSIAFRLRYGDVRFVMTGDLNQESMERLRTALPDASLRAEILKTPHHGSADFDSAFLREVGPVVSIISSGDESAAKEYIHPRATLMAALGRASRSSPALIFCTELAAFFATRGYVTDPKTNRQFFAFERTNFGIIHIRTDGSRVLALTHSGKKGHNEAYSFTVSPTGAVAFADEVRKRSAPK
jgi:ribonuclease BN (tRNA processing enzyme)